MTPLHLAQNLAKGDHKDRTLAVAIVARGLSDDDGLRQGWPLAESINAAIDYLGIDPDRRGPEYMQLAADALVLAPTISDAMLNRHRPDDTTDPVTCAECGAEIETAKPSSTAVAYHSNGFGPSRPAINVKDYHSGLDYIAAADRLMPNASYDGTAAYDRVQSDFWQAAEEIAAQRGLGEIAQEGRSGGWLVFTDGPEPDSDPLSAFAKAEQREWLAAYRAMTEWADTWIADAPRKVAALAQQYAMDEAGEAAASRMFAFGRA